MKLDFKKMNGLIPTVIMDDKGELLVLAYSSEESLKKTLKTGLVNYWSRTERRILQKNGQEITKITYNCSKDALQFIVKQTGVACHTGNYSCFHNIL